MPQSIHPRPATQLDPLDAAIEAADIALMADDLAKLPWLVRDSRRTLWVTIAADMGVSLLVIANALRLLAVRD